MFTLRDRRTGELFDRWSDFGDKRRRLMEQSWTGVFRNHLLVELPVDDLCRHLDERMGRPSKDLHVVIGVLLLQQLHDLSDAETVEALAFNMAWHYALLFSFAILERVLRDQFEIVDDEYGDRDATRAAIRDPKDVPCDTVGNPADPDASYNAHKGQGYMAQIVETYCEDVRNEAVAATPDLITHVEVHKMTVHDGHRLADALDDLSERALTPAVMLGDSHYGSSDNMALTREQNINLVAPARPPKGAVSGRLTLEDFTLNEEGLVLRCPNNVEPVSASLAKAKLQARFDLSICQKCPDILRCPVQAAKRDGQFSRFQYTPARAANQKRRLYEQSDAFRNVYRWRAGIEATMSRLKYQMNLAHLRIRGMPAMRYVVNLRALGLNIRRCAAIAP